MGALLETTTLKRYVIDRGVKTMGIAAFGIVFLSATFLLRIILEKWLLGGEK
jgi:hypothetical protein